ncbi:MAG: hypothetical protein ABI843_12980 [Dokdonella sp.]
MKTLLFQLAAACFATAACAAESAPSREHFAPPGYEAAYHDWHYTPVLRVGETVIVSGIPAAGPGSYEDKVRRMFGELR